MQGAVLLDERAAVDAYDLAFGECLANNAQRLAVEVGLGIGGAENGAVDHEEIGIGGRKAAAFVVVDGAGHG